MDLAVIISVVALVVSSSISIVTLLLTEFRGPNISLLDEPEFKLNVEDLDEIRNQDYVAYWFKLEPVSFVFANHGGRSGVIRDIKVDFVPSNLFEQFFERFYFSFQMPVVIMEGDSHPITTDPVIHTCKWKETALAEALDPTLTVDRMIEKALERSRQKFGKFCDFLENSDELGKVSCTVTMTKGRFRTKMKTEKLLENTTVAIYDRKISVLRDSLSRWENLRPKKPELSMKIRGGLEELIRELKSGLKISRIEVNEQSIGGSMLRFDCWKRLQQTRPVHERKIRWFLINSQEGLKQNLIKLYEEIANYNSTIEEALSLADLRTQKHFREINRERERLRSQIETMLESLSSLHKRYV